MAHTETPCFGGPGLTLLAPMCPYHPSHLSGMGLGPCIPHEVCVTSGCHGPRQDPLHLGTVCVSERVRAASGPAEARTQHRGVYCRRGDGAGVKATGAPGLRRWARTAAPVGQSHVPSAPRPVQGERAGVSTDPSPASARPPTGAQTPAWPLPGRPRELRPQRSLCPATHGGSQTPARPLPSCPRGPTLAWYSLMKGWVL